MGHPWRRGIRISYIYRDIRDVAVSLIEKEGPGDERILGKLGDALTVYDELRTVRDSPHVLGQRYEDVVADRDAATREAADFLGLDIPPATTLRSRIPDSTFSATLKFTW